MRPRLVVVTGASSGIGAACVRAFREAGAEVVGVDLADSSGADLHLPIDLAAPDCGQQLLDGLDGRESDGLVNNAGVELDKAAAATSADDFDLVYRVNLRAPLLLAAALHPSLQARGGFVVNIASVHATATSHDVSAYAATKGGLVSLTRALAVEWAPDIRVNAVLPGAIDTDMLRGGLARTGSTLDSLAARHPLGRVGATSEIAEAVLFLARNEFVTGTTLLVDGGATAHLSTE